MKTDLIAELGKAKNWLARTQAHEKELREALELAATATNEASAAVAKAWAAIDQAAV